jgi:hypothetical protein
VRALWKFAPPVKEGLPALALVGPILDVHHFLVGWAALCVLRGIECHAVGELVADALLAQGGQDREGEDHKIRHPRQFRQRFLLTGRKPHGGLVHRHPRKLALRGQFTLQGEEADDVGLLRLRRGSVGELELVRAERDQLGTGHQGMDVGGGGGGGAGVLVGHGLSPYELEKG